MILVTGATGFVGRHLVPALIEAGWPVRVLVRDERQGRTLPWADLPVELAVADLSDAAALEAAMLNVHTVVHLASAQWWGTARELERVDVGVTNAVLKAARAARIGRIVIVSHLGAAPASAYGLLRAKGLVEERVQASGVPYTIIRSGILFGEEDRFVNNVAMLLHTNPLVFLQPGQGENLLHPLYIHDLVRALVACMDNLSTVDRLLEVGGPEYITFNEMVRTVMRVNHVRRSIVTLPPYTLRFLTRLGRQVFPRWPATPQWFDILASHRTASLSSMAETFGFQPVRFEDTLLTYMPQRRFAFEFLRFIFGRRRPRGILN